MQSHLQRLLSIKEYNTPVVLRHFIHTVLILAVFILSPQFASMGWAGVAVAPLATLMILTLLHIQDRIEAPFGKRVDDIHFAFIERIQERLLR